MYHATSWPLSNNKSGDARIGLIIQGPLITYGQGPNNTPTGFDALGDITTNVEQAKRRGIPYCICTWEPQTSSEIDIFNRLHDKQYQILALTIPSMPDPDHRYKHHYAIRKAIDLLDTSYIVKIRSDMVMPDSFWSWITEHLNDRLTVSELITPFYLGDFIYAGKREVMLRFLEGFLAYGSKNLHPSITTDVGFKFFEATTGKRISACGMYLLHTIFRRRADNQWTDFTAKHLNVIPSGVFRNIHWRGRKIENFINVAAFKFDTGPGYQPLEVQFLLNEYLRYFAKRRDWRRFAIVIALRIHKNVLRIARLPTKVARLFRSGCT